MVTQLQKFSLLRGNPDPVTIHPFRCQSAVGELDRRRDKQPWAFKHLLTLGTLARAMGYLVCAL